MRRALAEKSRVIITPESSEHRVFVFVPSTVRAQGSLFCITRDDEVTLGILSSRIHEVWATAQGNRLGAGNQRRYNIGVSFETFPLPDGLTLDIPATIFAANPVARRIAAAARTLDDQRSSWLNPANLVRRVPDVSPGYPDRILPVDAAAAGTLKQRTLTNLYNVRPAWLVNAHRELDEAVAAAYGWPANLSDEEVLGGLLALNLATNGVAVAA